MVIEGMVVDVMETWPLQLTLLSAESQFHITLTMDTSVTQDGKEVGMQRIRPGQHARILGKRIGDQGIAAEAIAILDEA